MDKRKKMSDNRNYSPFSRERTIKQWLTSSPSRRPVHEYAELPYKGNIA